MKEFLTFRRMVTPSLIPILFWLGVVGCIAGGIVMIIVSQQSYGPSVGRFRPHPYYTEMLAGGICQIVLGPVIWRIFCELLVIPFRINENVQASRKRLESVPAAGGTPPAQVRHY